MLQRQSWVGGSILAPSLDGISPGEDSCSAVEGSEVGLSIVSGGPNVLKAIKPGLHDSGPLPQYLAVMKEWIQKSLSQEVINLSHQLSTNEQIALYLSR